jgi:KamA family protein
LQVSVVVHCNHARELHPALTSACAKLRSAGVTLLNQSVLLRGVNDCVASLRALSDALFDAGVLPYYLHQLDPVAGAAHFLVPRSEALALHTALRAELPGYLVPKLVVETPGACAKTPLADNPVTDTHFAKSANLRDSLKKSV